MTKDSGQENFGLIRSCRSRGCKMKHEAGRQSLATRDMIVVCGIDHRNMNISIYWTGIVADCFPI
jgi:hypothetical protein